MSAIDTVQLNDIRRRYTPEEFKQLLETDKKLAKKYATLSEAEKRVYEKCARIGIEYKDHPKPPRKTYMLSGIMAVKIVSYDPQKYPIQPLVNAPEGFTLDDANYALTTGLNGIVPAEKSYCVNNNKYINVPNVVRCLEFWRIKVIDNEIARVQFVREFYTGHQRVGPFRPQLETENKGDYLYNKHKFSQPFTIKVAEEVQSFDLTIDEVIQYWEEKLQFKMVRTERLCKSYYVKLCSCDLVYDDE